MHPRNRVHRKRPAPGGGKQHPARPRDRSSGSPLSASFSSAANPGAGHPSQPGEPEGRGVWAEGGLLGMAGLTPLPLPSSAPAAPTLSEPAAPCEPPIKTRLRAVARVRFFRPVPLLNPLRVTGRGLPWAGCPARPARRQGPGGGSELQIPRCSAGAAGRELRIPTCSAIVSGNVHYKSRDAPRVIPGVNYKSRRARSATTSGDGHYKPRRGLRPFPGNVNHKSRYAPLLLPGSRTTNPKTLRDRFRERKLQIPTPSAVASGRELQISCSAVPSGGVCVHEVQIPRRSSITFRGVNYKSRHAPRPFPGT